MIRNLAIIPVRAGSKGVPNKNKKLLAGVPLVVHTLRQARLLFEDADICVSTDDLEIVKILEGENYEAPFIRPDELATDTATTDDVIRHVLSYYEKEGKSYDAVTLLQATSPFRTVADIQSCISKFDSDSDMVVSVKRTKANPYYVLFEENDAGYLQKCKVGNFGSRQECPTVWEYNGAVYIINSSVIANVDRSAMTKVRKMEMNEEKSLDIDTPLDWEFAEFLIEKAIVQL